MKLHLGFAAPIAITTLSAGLYLALSSPSQTVDTQTLGVKVGRDYYVAVVLLEVAETDADGEPWDEANGTAPDPFYEVYWRGSRVFQSTVREDSLLAKWSNVEVSLTDIALKGGSASIDSLIQAARVAVRPQEAIELKFYDSDVIGKDVIGTLNFETKELRLGDTSYNYDSGAIRRITLRVADLGETPDVTR